jgi:hypothetical protein
VEADEDTDVEVRGNVGTGPDSGGAWTRSAVVKQSVSAASAAVSAVKAAEKKKKRKRKATSPSAVVTPSIPAPRPREVDSKEEEEDEAVEDSLVEAGRPARRSESPAAKRQRELVEKTSEDALCRGLEAQQAAAVAQAKLPTSIRPWFFRPKPLVPTVTR